MVSNGDSTSATERLKPTVRLGAVLLFSRAFIFFAFDGGEITSNLHDVNREYEDYFKACFQNETERLCEYPEILTYTMEIGINLSHEALSP